uniref:Uncharacterized protein n=1 Tax=Cucumis melo TaxID=3656 RepID=A0A9I9EB56_CUCME
MLLVDMQDFLNALNGLPKQPLTTLIVDSGARDVLNVGVFEESLYLQKNFNLQGWSASGVMESSGSLENSL